MHIFAITSPPSGVHIFAWPANFRNFAAKPCIFSHTTPVRVHCTTSVKFQWQHEESTLQGHSLWHCQVYERPHRGACRHRAGSNVCRVVGVDGRELVHIVNLHVQRCVCVCLCACVRPLALVCGRGRRMGAVSLGVGATRGLRLTMMPPLSRIPRAVGLARQCSACNVAPFRRWKPATGSSAW